MGFNSAFKGLIVVKWSEGLSNMVSTIIRRYTDNMEFAAYTYGCFIYHILSCSFGSIFFYCIYGCVLLFNFVHCVSKLLCLHICSCRLRLTTVILGVAS